MARTIATASYTMFLLSALGRLLQCLALVAVLAATADAQTSADIMNSTKITSPGSNETIAIDIDYTIQWAVPAGVQGTGAIWLLGQLKLGDSTKVGIRKLADDVQLSSQSWVWRQKDQISASESGLHPSFTIYMQIAPKTSPASPASPTFAVSSGEFHVRNAVVPPPSNDTTTLAKASPQQPPLKPEVIAAIAIGAAALAALIVGVVCYDLRLRRLAGPKRTRQTRDGGSAGGDDKSGDDGGLSKAELEGSGGHGSAAGAVAGALDLKPELMEKEVHWELGGREHDRERPDPREAYEVAAHEIHEMEGCGLPEKPDLVVGTQEVGVATEGDEEAGRDADAVTPAVSPVSPVVQQ
ncbi:hypothetical protein RB595_009026 [Gaeumannomyces hyphopodioides]